MSAFPGSRGLRVVRMLSTLGVMGLLVVLPNHLAANEPEEPKLRLRANPTIAFVPANILFVAELRGGDDDYRDLYCVTVEWDWDDDTRSESTPDCDPYEPGVSRIQRRYTTRHTFDIGGRYDIRVRLKQRDKVVATAKAILQVRGGF